MLDFLQSLDFQTGLFVSFLVNYWIHSSLFLLLVLAGLKLHWIKSDYTGEKLLKMALLLGVFSAAMVNFRGGDANTVLRLAQTEANPETSTSQANNPQLPKTENDNSEGLQIMDANASRLSKVIQSENAASVDAGSSTFNEHLSAPVHALWSSENFTRLTVILSFCYLCGVVLMLVVRLYQFNQVNKLMAHKKPLLDVMLLSGLASLKSAAGVKNNIKLYSSQWLSSPVVMNLSEIILPQVFVSHYSSEQQQAALAHELAHIKRNDVMWQKMFVVFDILFFFQPLNRILRKSLHQMVEQRADDMAAQWTGNPRALAEAISVTAQQQLGNRHARWVLAMKCEKSNLLQRVENLLKGGMEKTKASAITFLTAICGLILVSGPGVAFTASISASEFVSQPTAPTNAPESSPGSVQSSTSHVSDGHSFSFSEIEDEYGVGHVKISHSTDDTSWKLTSRLTGKIRFNYEETQILYFPEDSELDVRIDDGEDKQRILISRDNGETEYRYYINRQQIDITQDPNWQAGFIPDLLRSTGWNAKQRAARIFSQGGTSAVLQEVSLMRSEQGKAQYLMHIPQLTTLSAQEVNQIFHATSHILSDHQKAKTLKSLFQNIRFAGNEWFTDENWEELLTVTTDIESDMEMARVMRSVVMAVPLDSYIWPDVFAAMHAIESDFELAKLLSELITHRPLAQLQLEHMLTATRSIESDFELAALLIHMVEHLGLPQEVVSDWLSAAKTVESDFEMARTLNALTVNRLSEQDLINTITLAREEIESDFELAGFFKVLMHNQSISGKARDVLYDSLSAIDSDHERLRVIEDMKARDI